MIGRMLRGITEPGCQRGPGDRRRVLYSLKLLSPALVLGLCLLTSCSRGPENGDREQKGIRKEFDRGPVKVSLSIDRSELTIAERLHLIIEIISDEDYEAQLPALGEKLDQFGIVDYHTFQPELLDGQKLRIGRSYVLEPFLSGEYTIPAMEITFEKKGEDSGKVYKVETETIGIKVTSLLPETLEELNINDTVDPVALPRSWTVAIGAGVILVFIAGTILTVVLLRKRRKTAAAEVERVPAHVIAVKELERLIAEDLIKRGELKNFYRRLSYILRTYIENRFGLRAPEQTTEEFLSSLGASKVLEDNFKSLLDTFLKHCDLVKFAELQPTTKDVQQAFDSCKAFIVATREDVEMPVRKLDY